MLRDSKGNLVPVLDLPFEEFERLLRIRRGLGPPAPPGYTLDSLSVAGTANKDLADLQVTATIRVREAGWVRVPLALGNAVLRQPARHEGPGEHYLAYDAEESGFVAWLKGADAKPHVLTLQVSAAITQSDSNWQLALALPRATESSLRVTVPEARADAKLTGGEGILSSRPQGQDQSELAVLGAAGALELTWQAGQAPTATATPLLESSGEILVKVEGEYRISSEARLKVRSFAGAIDAFRVRLPEGMDLVPTNPAGYSVTVVSTAAAASGDRQAASQIVEVRFDRPATGVVEVRLLAAPSATSIAGPLAPARFDVLGAVRQRGTIDFALEGDWQLAFQEDASVRRLDVASDPASARLAARYEYSRQPCTLRLTVTTRPSRASVEPIHVVYVEDKQLRLESTFKYRFRGARAEGLVFNLGDWRLSRVAPADLLDITAPDAPAGKSRMIPLRLGAVLPGELELKLDAHRPLDSTTGEVSFTLPRPEADVVAPATVIISAADNVELTPQPAKITGLSLDLAPAVARIPSRQQPPLVYRDLGADEAAVFVADLRVRTRWTTASARGKVKIDQQQMEIEQRLDYRVAYEARRLFEILVPRSVLLAGPFTVSLADEPLTPTPLPNAPLRGDSARFQVSAPDDQIGLCQLLVKYTLPLPKWDRQKPQSLTIPLVIPADEPHQQLGGQQIELVTSGPWRLEPDPTGSDEFSRPTLAAIGGPTLYAWSRATTHSQWIIDPVETGLPATVLLDKAWIQTWLADGVRQDRAVFRLTTQQDQLRYGLAHRPIDNSVQATINGQPAAALLREPATLLIDLPAAARGRECVIELWYSMPESAAAAGLVSTELKAPLLEEASPPRRMFWQLCLPGDKHLLLPPANLTAEMRWDSLSWLGGRQPTLGQVELEAWIGASRQDPLPRDIHEYLYSSLGRAPTLAYTAAGRRLLLAAASGLALALGLLILHVRAIRRSETILLLGVALTGLALALPDAALLAAQCAALGLAVALAAALWTWATSGRSTWLAARRNTSLASAESRSTEAPLPRLERLAGLSTATAPAGAAAEPQR
jgi:hypothetical protein